MPIRAAVFMCACACLSKAPWHETLQVSCGNCRHSSSSESGTSSLCFSCFGKADFGKPNRSWRCWGELRWRRRRERVRGMRFERRGETDACLWDVCALSEPSLLLKVHPTQKTIKGCDCHHTASPSVCLPRFYFEISIQSASALCYHGKAKQLATCKQNHVCLL